MRIAIACMGSRGDISPLLALAHVFVARGDTVKIGCTVESRRLVESHGFEPHVLTTLNLKDFLQSPLGQKKFFGTGTATQLRAVGKLADAHADEFDEHLTALCRDVDCVISTRIIEERAALVTHRERTPLVMLEYFPGDAHTPVPNPILGPGLQDFVAKVPALIPWTYRLFDVGWALSIYKKTVHLAERVGYPHRIVNPRSVLRRRDLLRVGAFGRALVPPRTIVDMNQPRIGFIRLRDRAADRAPLDAEVEAWIAQDDRPIVYVGFGSMPIVDFDGVLGDLSARLAREGMRVLAVPGWSARTGDEVLDTPDLLVVPDVDHDAVFPRCAALVHHGGAGTTAIAAASGAPSLVCSQAFDQHFWGRRIEARGAGIVSSRRDMTAESLAQGVLALVRDESIVAGARELGSEAAADLDGCREFIAAFDAFIASAGPRRGAPEGAGRV
ncbi:glycosyltransferase [Tsukamurella sp. 1534]|uniref:glycosyltransferase n=1 Tax=Tsukamurella sp. 1534 TaxID=1151061 RepID=UPI0002F241CE|nr:glycosyltransferase [Tsukamurella sp. 1534]